VCWRYVNRLSRGKDGRKRSDGAEGLVEWSQRERVVGRERLSCEVFNKIGFRFVPAKKKITSIEHARTFYTTYLMRQLDDCPINFI
jgi:hypothetical protein